jgi:hypothetical protein
MLQKKKKYDANTNSWITSRIFSDYLTPINRKMGGKNKKSCFSWIN